MRFSRALRRFLLGYLILHLLTVCVFVLVLTRIVRNQMIRDTQSRMSAMTTMLAEHVNQLEDGLNNPNLADQLKRMGDQTSMRITVITADGIVVADSITGTRDIGPHGTREEVLLAKSEGIGFSQRYSSTLDEPMMYFARDYEPTNPDHDRGFVRVAIPSVSIRSAVGSIQSYVWLFAIALSALAAFLMALFSARILEPLNRFSQAARRIGVGQYDTAPVVMDRNDEWGEMGEAFQQMQSELTRREDRLIENSQRLEAVLSSMIEGVIAIDSAGEVMLANGAACRMLGLSKPELVGRTLLEIVRIPELRNAVVKTQTDRTFSKTEFNTLAKPLADTLTEPQRTLSARVSLMTDKDESGAAIVLHDVTELRQLETMRQDFVANVSHELKTPLSSIKAYAETLRLGALHDNEKNMQFVEQIETQAEMLNLQIQDLLQLARVESGEKTFSIGDIDINEVCRSLHEQFASTAKARELELLLELKEPAPLARADRGAIETIVKNLIVNAIHYTPSGGSVTISTSRNDQSSLIQVTDTGIGIASDQQARVFERFYRVDKARSRDIGGTGLGLSIVKHLCQAFGGSIHLESQLGKGSQFVVDLPSTS